jgi:hypothetical protein
MNTRKLLERSAALFALLLAGAGSLPAAGAGAAAPNFAPDSIVGWIAVPGGFKAPPSGPGPIVNDPAHPVFVNLQPNYPPSGRIVGPQPTFADGTPAGFEVLGTAPARLLSITEDECEAPEALWASVEPPGDLQGVAAGLFGEATPENIEKVAYNHAVMGTFSKGKGRVFNAGTTDWAFGLDRDPFVQQVTINIVRQLGGVG